MKYYTLEFKPGTITEIKGSKAELVAELRNLIDEIEALDDEDTDIAKTVVIYDMNCSDYIEARISD